MCRLLAIIALFLPIVPPLLGSPKQELAAGIKAAESYDWTEAAAHFRSAESHPAQLDTEETLLARVGFMRSTMEQRNLAQLTRQYQEFSASLVVRNHPRLRMWLYIAKGDCDNDLQFPEAARLDWEIVKRVATMSKDSKWVYRAEGELAIPAYYRGDLADSRRLVSEALESASAANDTASVVRLLTHIGAVYMMRGDFAEGMNHLSKAEKLATSTGNREYPVTIKESELLGLIGTGKLNEAMSLANDIIARMHREDRRINESQTRVMLARIYQAQQNLPAAIHELTTAIQIATKGNYYHSLSDAQMVLADIYLQMGDVPKASDWVASSLSSTLKSGIVSDLPAHMLLLARLRSKEGRYTDADLVYKKAENEVDAQLALTPTSSKPLLLKSTSDIYTDHFALVADHLHNVSSEYGIVERVRGRMLTDLLKTGSFSDASSDSLTEREVSALRLRLASATSDEEIARAREAIFFARHKRWLDKETDSSRVLRRNSESVLPIQVVQSNLQPAELLIEYVVTSQSVYAVVITGHSARVAKLGRTSDSDEVVRRFVAAVHAKQDAWKEGAALYSSLFAAVPEIANHPDLIIVPDGRLYSIPFAALVGGGKRLIETHSIVRAPSASAYVLLRRRVDSAVHDGLLAVGGVRYSPDLSHAAQIRGYGEQLSNLPGSEEEADAASDVLGPLLGQSLLLEGESATETAVKDGLKQQREVIDLAVHGMSHTKDDPELAALIFLPDKKAGEDGMLEVPEIVQLHLRSDLVVLSACETAVGELEGEEGVSNLARSFLLAGAESVTSTLWSVDDAFSATLMKNFYQLLSEGSSKAEALENAQRYILKEFKGTAVPWYWAGYVIEGDATSPLPTLRSKMARLAEQQWVHSPNSVSPAYGREVRAR